ncbi:amino acid transporter [Saccharothrix saharensis]|uniref:Amino acid transporter n=1 Tax=Saccharothrix saharensis TaxID=571190 RepID=A0A543JP07_9PSEU|nr:APC family permease [Saccharothrix saharensis]TQM84495.1 amino acid transporter [Saccharothrix saharensis]
MSRAHEGSLTGRTTIERPRGGTGVGEAVFPGRSMLPVTASWWTSILVAVGASLMIAVSMAEMAAEIGNASIWVWIGTAIVGALQCLLIAELASRFTGRAGGTAQFAYRATAKGSPTLGALSSWAYWFAWTPGIAVNLILAATYLKSLFWPSGNVIFLAVVIGIALYCVTALGLRLSTMVNAALAVVALGVVSIVVLTPVFHPDSFDVARILPTRLPEDAPTGGWGVAGIVLKWMFIATWAAYAAEMASTVCAEIKRPERYMKRVMSISAGIAIAAFTLVPISMFGVVGVEGLQRDPFTVFAEIGGITLGPAGEYIVGLGLAAVLVLGAEIFIIGSSRTIHQMAQDGNLPKVFGRTNKRGAPVGSIAFDAVVIIIMLVVFGTRVVSVVAAATFGYLVVFVLLPIAYLTLRRFRRDDDGGFRLGRAFVGVAVALFAFNTVLLVFGGLQWGVDVIIVGLGVTLSVIPISYFTRKSRTKAAVRASGED